MKIALIGINSRYIHKNLAIYSLYSYVKEDSNQYSLMEFSINEPFDKIFYSIYSNYFEVIAFNVYLWNKELVLNLIDSLKKLNPEIKIVLGGPEINDTYQKNSNIDYLIIGEGEIPFKKLINSNFINKERILKTKDEYLDLNQLPFVYQDFLDELNNKIIYYEGSRGCPFQCSYCLSGSDNKLRLKNPDKIYEEIKILVEAGVRQVKFIDRTFNANPEWAINIVENLKKLGDYNCNFHIEASIDKMNIKLLSMLENCQDKLFQLEVGIQTTNLKTLRAIGRYNDFEKIAENCQRIIAKGNIHIHTDLIAGLPFEDYNSFKKSFNEVYSIKAHMLQVGFLKVIPNTRMYEDAEKLEIKYQSNPPYEVIATKWISTLELLKIKYVETGVDTFYNNSVFRQTFNYFDKLRIDFFEFFQYIGRKIFFRKNFLSISDKFDFLYQVTLEYFNTNLIIYSDEHFLAVLKLDWYLNLKDKKRPKIFTDELYVDIKNYIGKADNINKYKVIELPFIVIQNGVDYEINENGKVNKYMIDYTTKRSIYDYPLLTLIDSLDQF